MKTGISDPLTIADLLEMASLPRTTTIITVRRNSACKAKCVVLYAAARLKVDRLSTSGKRCEVS